MKLSGPGLPLHNDPGSFCQLRWWPGVNAPLLRFVRRLTGGPSAAQGPAMSGQPNPIVTVGGVSFGNALPLALIAGPCALESRAHALEMASALKEIANRLKLGFVYKTSFDKANRTSGTSARGLGLDAALPIFAEIRQVLHVPVLTDVHEWDQCARAAEVV